MSAVIAKAYVCENCGVSFTRHFSMLRHKMESCIARFMVNDVGGKRPRLDGVASTSATKTCTICNVSVPANRMAAHQRTTQHKHNSCVPLCDGVQLVNSAFKSRIATYRISSNTAHIDFTTFFNDIMTKVFDMLEQVLRLHQTIKANMNVVGQYFHQTQDVSSEKSFNIPNKIVDAGSDLNDVYHSFVETMKTQSTEFQEKDSDYGTFDFIIIGGGTAGGVLANRLTEQSFTVLVIEAGEAAPVWASIIGITENVKYYLEWNWGYNTTRQNTSCLAMKSEKCFYPRGKSLGGCSVINGGMYVRGKAEDYDEWQKMGNHGWSYSDCLPYFKKSERANFADGIIDPEYHGFNGVQEIGIPPNTEGLTVNLVNAAQSLGKKEIDYNGISQDGIGRMQFYLDNNTRTSTDHAFIQPILGRTNLNITLKYLATKILISEVEKKAEAVEFVKNGQKYKVKARKEIIVSAGSINSPQVLMLSGIGPAAELQRHNIKVFADLPVGENFYDHTMFTAVCFRTNQVFYNNTLVENLNLWREGKRPLVAGIGVHVVGFLTPETEVLISTSYPDWGLTYQLKDEYVKAFKVLNAQTDICTLTVLLKPKSFGKVTLRSNDARDFPLIDPQFFSNPADLEAMYKGIQEILKLDKTEVFKQWNATLVAIPMPGCDESYERLSKDWWYCAIKSVSTTIFHPIGTTRMAPNPESSVVNSELRVHGFKNLRVVDAGVIPSHISGHTNAPVVMIAEKISDVIKRDWKM